MARRAPLDEKPYRPLDASMLSAVLQPGTVAAGTLESVRVATPTAPVVVTLRSEPSGRPSALNHEKRILFTREEARSLDRIVGNLAERLQTPVKVSHVFRALAALLLSAERDLAQAASIRAPLIRPPNGDLAALHEFERQLARMMAEALRSAEPRRNDW
jgi:hypothetical protein